jgi:hypothetical protein
VAQPAERDLSKALGVPASVHIEVRLSAQGSTRNRKVMSDGFD